MNVSDTISLASVSPLGSFLIVLAVLVLALMLVYSVVHWRNRQLDILASKYSDHFQRAEALAVGWTFDVPPRIDFFGRQTLVSNAAGREAICTIPSPDMSTEDVQERFEDFQGAVHHLRLPGLKGWRLLKGSGVIESINQGRRDFKGRPYPTVREITLDAHIKAADIENLLILLSRSLSALHDLKSPKGCITFHGFLLPRAVSVIFSQSGAVQGVCLADTGWAYSLGLEGIRARLALLKSGKLLIDRRLGRELIEQMPNLAPELQPEATGGLLGPECDFYSFGAMAVALFSEERFVGPESVHWEKVPQQWRRFLQRCLQRNPLKRPKDFLELEEWLTDPERLLAQSSGECGVASNECDLEMYNLGDLLRRLQSQRYVYPSSERSPELEGKLMELQKQVSSRKWAAAYEVAKSAQVLSQDPEIRLYRLMAAHELGKMQEVQQLSGELEAEDAHLMRRFRDFVAFHV